MRKRWNVKKKKTFNIVTVRIIPVQEKGFVVIVSLTT